MARLLVAYPKLSERDFNWIQEYRRRHDPANYALVDPHFTVVFAIEKISLQAFVREVQKRTAGLKPIDFELTTAALIRDNRSSRCHECLLPGKGYAAIVALHDTLYSGGFSKHLRFDLPYVPHLGIGSSYLAAESQRRIDLLNALGVSIAGRIETLNAIDLKRDTVTTIKKIPLR